MRMHAVWVFLILFFQLPGCAFAQTGKCQPSEKNRTECVKELKDQSEARRRAQLRNRERVQVLPSAPLPQRQAAPQPIQPSQPSVPAAPPVTTSCDAGGCWDSNANRYSRGAGNVYLDRAGKPCHLVGATMQCF
jgi:hypothetical protein